MALILSLETSTTVCSVALHSSGKLLALSEVHIEQSHASKLAVLVEEIKRAAGIGLSELDAVAISSGPGSYTGLRIGTSTAKGLCYSLEIPLIAVNTLELMAHQMSRVNVDHAWLCPMIDARRMEVYCQLTDALLKPVLSVEARVIDETSFAAELEKNVIVFFGNGAEKCEDVITHSNARFVTGIYPSAASLGVLASRKFQKEELEDLVHFEPFYLKEFLIKKAADIKPVQP
jgi:tRNA threonylcarbamoyladenosine biosynthesis protein TsaB